MLEALEDLIMALSFLVLLFGVAWIVGCTLSFIRQKTSDSRE